MDDQNKNLILATVLSALVILVWTVFFSPPPAPPADLTPPAATVGQAQAPAPTTTTATATPVATPDLTAATAPRLEIDTPRLAGSVSLLGGALDDLLLKDYRETLDPKSTNVRLFSHEGVADTTGAKPYYANYGWIAGAGLDANSLPGAQTLWSVESGAKLTPESPVTLVWDNGAGLTFRRTISVDANYMFTVTQSVENHGTASVKLSPYGLVLRQGAPGGYQTYVLHEGSIGMADGQLHDVTFKKLTKLDVDPTEGPADIVDVATNGWIGLTDKYWMTTLVPQPGQPFRMIAKYIPEGDYYVTTARMPEVEVAAGANAEATNMLFAGAKEWETIKTYQETLKIDRFEDSIDWGWFFFLTKPIFRVLHWLHGGIGNMGLAIIALTFLLKSLLFPLARKSYISMAKMKELQPEMEKLKEQSGDDRAKLQQGMMALYKKEKVNPASGCLPILLQIPIFYSLYKVIYVTLELRHAPFFGWIQDLSAPDPSSIINLFGLLPWAAPDQGSLFAIVSLGVLPILLGISMWFQQRLNPAPADPAQAAIFAWMPWVFMFMLGSFASGLVLYWITNNTITFVQQYTIMSLHGKRPDVFGNIRRPAKAQKPAAK